jgi:hypothetical protein
MASVRQQNRSRLWHELASQERQASAPGAFSSNLSAAILFETYQINQGTPWYRFSYLLPTSSRVSSPATTPRTLQNQQPRSCLHTHHRETHTQKHTSEQHNRGAEGSQAGWRLVGGRQQLGWLVWQPRARCKSQPTCTSLAPLPSNCKLKPPTTEATRPTPKRTDS